MNSCYVNKKRRGFFMKKNEIRDQKKVTDLVRSIMKLYLQKSGKYSIEEINKRVNENIKRVILKPRDGEYLGEASVDEPEITIYGVDDKTPTFEEIIWNLDYYKPTMIHEGEHKFFTHKDENGVVTGSALLRLINRNKEFKQWLKENVGHSDMKQIEQFIPNAKELKSRGINKTILDSEIGRGISEGFIEWYRVEVLGNKDNVTYENITSVIYKLQEYIDSKGEDGTEAISEYGDSDYNYVFDTLNMSKSTGIAFVRIIDVMYYLLEKKKVDRMDDIVRYFELEEANTLQPDFISRYGERIRGLDVFSKLQEEYKKIPYRKETFKEFVSRKNEERKRALARYERLIKDFLSRALEKRDKGEGALGNLDISDLISEAVILSAQNTDDIAEGMKISFEKNKIEVKAKPKKAKQKVNNRKAVIPAEDEVPEERIKTVELPREGEKDTEERELKSEAGENAEVGELSEAGEVLEEGKIAGKGVGEEEKLEEGEVVTAESKARDEVALVDGQVDKDVIPQGSSIDNIAFGLGYAIEDVKLGAEDLIDDIRFKASCIKEDVAFNVGNVVEGIKFNASSALEDMRFNIGCMRQSLRYKGRRFFDNKGKLTLIALAAAAGISVAALTAYLIGELRNIPDAPNIEVTEPQESETIHIPEIPIEIPEKPTLPPVIETEEPEPTFPFLNDNGTISLKAGSTIYRSSDKVGGKTTLKYDYENLIIDYIRLMQNNNIVLNAGDLSNLEEFMNSLGEEDLSIMMRLAVEQNGEKVYIAWCDYAEMLENAKSIEDVENKEDIER